MTQCILNAVRLEIVSLMQFAMHMQLQELCLRLQVSVGSTSAFKCMPRDNLSPNDNRDVLLVDCIC